MLSLSDILSNQDKLYSVTEVSEALRVNRNNVGNWCKEGKIKSELVGSTRVIRGEWVNDYLKSVNVGNLKHISQILSNFKLPHERE